MTTREFYESIGASYDNVLVRFGSEKMITKFAKRFADDTTFQDMCTAMRPERSPVPDPGHRPRPAPAGGRPCRPAPDTAVPAH